MTGTGYAPHGNFQLSHEPVAIISIDTSTKMAKGLTRVRAIVNIDCNYPVGGMYVLPATGEQWYIERLNDYHWKLVSRIPFNDDNTLLEPVPGQMIVGSTGPLDLNGSHVNVHGDTNVSGVLGVGSVTLKDVDGTLQQSSDGGATYAPVGGSEFMVEGSESGTPTALTLWTGTQDDYDAIPTKNPATVYVVLPP